MGEGGGGLFLRTIYHYSSMHLRLSSSRVDRGLLVPSNFDFFMYKMTDTRADEDIFWVKEENDDGNEESQSSSDPMAFSLSLTPEDGQSGGENLICPNQDTEIENSDKSL